MCDIKLPTRQGRWLICAVLAAAGCGDVNKPVGGPTVLNIDNGKRTVATVAVDARGVAEAFLKALCSGDAKTASARLDTAFKKYIAPPFFSDDKAIGFAESDVQKALHRLAAGSNASAIQFEAYSSNAVAFRGELTGGDGVRSFAIRLARANDSWLITHFQTARRVTRSITAKAGSSDAGWVLACAQDFLDLLVAGPDDHDLTLRLLSEEFKKQLPAPSIAEPGLGYARKDVRNWLNAHRGESTGYTLTAVEKEGDGFRLRGELTAAMNRPFSLYLAAVKGDCIVDRFEVK